MIKDLFGITAQLLLIIGAAGALVCAVMFMLELLTTHVAKELFTLGFIFLGCCCIALVGSFLAVVAEVAPTGRKR